MLPDDRAVGTGGIWLLEMETLFLGDDILDIDRFLARTSVDFLVCERALVGIMGASFSDIVFWPK
jgi:hypothetical protein